MGSFLKGNVEGDILRKGVIKMAEKLSTDEIVKQIKVRLTEAGYDYEEVQEKVNNLFRIFKQCKTLTGPIFFQEPFKTIIDIARKEDEYDTINRKIDSLRGDICEFANAVRPENPGK